jgi:GLPGLI family protein
MKILKNISGKMQIASLITLLIIISMAPTYGQATFIESAKVEYEKVINMHKLMDDGDSWFEDFKRRMPALRKLYFDLYLSGNQSLYKPGREAQDDKYMGWGDLTEANHAYQNHGSGTVVHQKQIYEEKFLVQDSLLNIEWKLLDETRTIAGFECRKALGRFHDSLYVVAFYTDAILINAGPEGFHGLPGLILGVAFPRIHTTWFATKVEHLSDKDVAAIKPPASGKKVNRNELSATVQSIVKRWSRWDKRANEVLWQLPW